MVVTCHPIATAHVSYESSSTLIDSNIFGNLVSSSKTKWKCNTQLSNFLKRKPAGAIDSFKSWKVLLYHVVEMLAIYLGRIFSWEDCEECGVHFSSRCKYFSWKSNLHSTEFFVASQSLLLTKRIHCLFTSARFRGKWNSAICFFSLLA